MTYLIAIFISFGFGWLCCALLSADHLSDQQECRERALWHDREGRG